jgi:hypothetical protein
MAMLSRGYGASGQPDSAFHTPLPPLPSDQPMEKTDAAVIVESSRVKKGLTVDVPAFRVRGPGKR